MVRLNLQWGSTAPGVRKAYERVSLVLTEGSFYLAGGTALALLEGHRISVDLDLFSPSLDDAQALLQEMETTLKDEISSTSIGHNAVHVEVSGVQISCIRHPYPLLQPVLDVEPDLLPLAHPDDIAAMKLAAITNRGSRKDFVDLWVLINRHRPLSECLGLFEKKYSKRDIGHVVRSLTYFVDADEDPPLKLRQQINWETVKADLRSAVQALL